MRIYGNQIDRFMKIVVTGCAGFIGYHLSKSLLDDGHKILGIDNVNDYYDINLKYARLDILKKYKNFIFNKIDISDSYSTHKSISSFKPKVVVNLAAQAGVRYSIKNPHAYIDSNILGFLNILEVCKIENINNVVYSSSSSVYGLNEKKPFNVNDKTDHQLAIYGVTKKTNELMAHSYSHLYGIHTTGLRYFTVYGTWGRPDMALYRFTKKILNNEEIQVYNYGKMKRDFTYIDDIIAGTKSAIDKNYKYEIFNLGNHKSENLMDMISILENCLKRKARIDFQPMQSGDISGSLADISKTIKMLNYNPSINIKDGIPKFVDWYKQYTN